jgi:dihydrofolate reductase
VPRKIIVEIAMSADGFIARPDGAVDWLDRPRPKHQYGMEVFHGSIDTIILGRKTYEWALDFQRQSKVRSVFDTRVKHYVFTRSLPPSAAVKEVEFVAGPVKAFAGRLRQQPGKNIWMMGGGDIIASFLDEGEIDEFNIKVIPTFIGEGIPLVAPRHRNLPLTLTSLKQFEDGVVALHYAVPRESRTI